MDLLQRPSTSGGPALKSAYRQTNNFTHHNRTSQDDIMSPISRSQNSNPRTVEPYDVSPWGHPQSSPAVVVSPQSLQHSGFMSHPQTDTPDSGGDANSIGMALGSPRSSNLGDSVGISRTEFTRLEKPPWETSEPSETVPSRSKSGKWRLFGKFGSRKHSVAAHRSAQADLASPPRSMSGNIDHGPKNAIITTKISSGRDQNPRRPKHTVSRSQTVPLYESQTSFGRESFSERTPVRNMSLRSDAVGMRANLSSSPPAAAPMATPKLSHKSSGLMLDVKIPSIKMERYSIMFSSVLEPEAHQTKTGEKEEGEEDAVENAEEKENKMEWGQEKERKRGGENKEFVDDVEHTSKNTPTGNVSTRGPKSGLLLRRQATLDKLRTIDEKVGRQFESREEEMRAAIERLRMIDGSADREFMNADLQGVARQPSHSDAADLAQLAHFDQAAQVILPTRSSPSFSLFPPAPTKTPAKLSPRSRSNTSPALLPSPSRAVFEDATPKRVQDVPIQPTFRPSQASRNPTRPVIDLRHEALRSNPPSGSYFGPDHSPFTVDSPVDYTLTDNDAFVGTAISTADNDVIPTVKRSTHSTITTTTPYITTAAVAAVATTTSSSSSSPPTSSAGSTQTRPSPSSSISSSARTYATKPSVETEEAADVTAAKFSDPVERSIQRQISVSRQQREMLQTNMNRGNRSASSPANTMSASGRGKKFGVGGKVRAGTGAA